MYCNLAFAVIFAQVSASPQSDVKAGIASHHFNDNRAQSAADAGIPWFYSWSTTDLIQNTHGLGFLPMQCSDSASGIAPPSGSTQPILLMYNEPDNAGQSAQCYENGQLSETAAKSMASIYCRQIKQFAAMGYSEFASPAFSLDPSDSAFLDNCVYPFFEAVAEDQDCRDLTQYFTWHMYTPCGAPSDITNFCTDRTDSWAAVYDHVEANYGFSMKGMYVTEYAGWYEGCVSQSDPMGVAGQARVAEHCTPVLRDHEKVARYAWFNDFEDYEGQGSSNIWNSNDELSPIGQAFFGAVSGSSSHSNTSSESSTTASTDSWTRRPESSTKASTDSRTRSPESST
jgi:hypothetical protein